jgi:hypothetical protein
MTENFLIRKEIMIDSELLLVCIDHIKIETMGKWQRPVDPSFLAAFGSYCRNVTSQAFATRLDL